MVVGGVLLGADVIDAVVGVEGGAADLLWIGDDA